MNELVRKLQRMFGVPRRDFVRSLRDELLEEFATQAPPLEDWLKRAGDIFPREEFCLQLKKRLLEEEKLSVLTRPRAVFFPRFSRHGKKIFVRALQVATSGVAMLAIAITAVFFGWSSVTLATTATYLTAFSGDVTVVRNGNRETVVTSEIPISVGTVISTGANSGAEIRFFEDSVLRLDADSKVIIDELIPHYSQNDLGFVRVTLISGRVWTRTFASDDEFSRFTLSLSKDREVQNDSGGVIDASVNPSTIQLSVWERSVILSQSQKNSLLTEGKKFVHQNGAKDEILPLGEAEKAEKWVTLNREKDIDLVTKFIALKTGAAAQNAPEKNSFPKLLPVRSEAEDAILNLQNIFSEALSMQSGDERNAALLMLADKTRSAREPYPQETDAFLASAEKTLGPVLPDSELFAVKKFIESLCGEFSDTPKLITAEQQRTERLWEARQLAGSGNIQLAESIVRESTDSTPENTAPVSPEDAEKMLEEKQEQLVMLGEIQKEGVAKEAVKAIEEEIITDSSHLLRPGFPNSAPRDLTARADDIIERVAKYKSEVGQKNTLLHHLNAIDQTADNLQLLVKLKKEVPEELEADVTEQILTILDVEREKVRVTKSFSSAAPCAIQPCMEVDVTVEPEVSPIESSIPQESAVTIETSPASETPRSDILRTTEASLAPESNMSPTEESFAVGVWQSIQPDPENAPFLDDISRETMVIIPDSLEIGEEGQGEI